MNRIINYTKNLPEWAFLCLYFGSIFVYSAIVGLQGFDMCDEGWVLSAYQQIFKHPESCQYQFLYYNTILVGGVWNLLFGNLGYFGFRLFAAICKVLVALVVYLTLRKHVNRWAIFAGILLFNFGYAIVFHQNIFTALLCCTAILFIFKALQKDDKWFMIVGGMIVGINFFSRLPNLSMLSFSLIFIPYYLYNRDIKQTLQMMMVAICGVAIGVLAEVGMMIALGHWNIFVDNIASGTSAASASDSTHSLSNILKVYKGNYITVYKQLIIFTSFPMAMYFVNKLIDNKKIVKWLLVFGGCVYFYTLWGAELTFILYAFCYITFLLYLLKHYQDKEITYLITLASIMLFFLPFGSDYGIGNMGPNCIWFAVPLAVGLFFKLIQDYSYNPYYKKLATITLTIFLSALSMHDIYHTSLNCYFDHGSRLKKTSRIHHPLATTFTSKEKCDFADELLSHLEPLVQPDDYLLCFECIPTVNYLTQTRPYLRNSWPWTYDAANMERQFQIARENIDVLPVIVRDKSAIAEWHKHNKDWNSLKSDNQWNFNTKKIKLIQDFIRDNNYSVNWENDLFQILVPPTEN